MGEPPEHPLKLARWTQRILAIDLYRTITGKADQELSSQVRATATAISRIMPADIIVEAERLIKADNEQLVDNDGPETEPVVAEEFSESTVHCPATRGRAR